jgi:hypothetical protein
VDQEVVWMRRLQRSVDAVREWEERIGSPEDVELKSSLAKDDAGLPGHPVRSAAWYGLVTAVDHLALGADLFRDGLTIRPSSLHGHANCATWCISGGLDLVRHP